MTPQERQLVEELFDRLAALESEARDAEAVDVINEGLARAPNAVYPLVQTVLVQDEALRRADARIRELEAELGITSPPQSSGSFLEGMRDALLGRREQQGSVPTVRPGAPASSAWGQGAERPPFEPGAPGYGPAPSQGPGGGTFLGTAAAAAAGAIGGALLMQGLRGLFGSSAQAGSRVFDQPPQDATSPWGSGGGSSGDLAREAGIDDIGGMRQAALGGGAQAAGLFDAPQGRAELFEGDDDADFDVGDGDDSEA